MPKVHDPIPSRTFSVPVVGDNLESLTELVAEARRLKPEWHETPQTILISIVEDFLAQPDALDQFVLTRVDSEQRALLRQIEELKGLKRAARAGTLDEEASGSEEGDGQPAFTSPATPPPLGSASPAVR